MADFLAIRPYLFESHVTIDDIDNGGLTQF